MPPLVSGGKNGAFRRLGTMLRLKEAGEMARYRVAVDTGGTFSDFVYLNETTGAVTITKVPSTPDDPSRAILAGIEALIAPPSGSDAMADTGAEVSYFCHGTTVGTNALLEGKGVRTGLLVTKGFRGIYEVAEQARPYGTAIFDVMYDKPTPLVPQSRTGEVAERVDFRGKVLVPLDEAALRATLRDLQGETDRGARGLPACSRSCIPSTKRAYATSRPRKCPAATYRCRRKSCRRSANITGSPRRSSTLICSRSSRATSPTSIARLNGAGVATPAEIHHAVERRHVDVRRGRAHRRDHGAVRAGRRRHRRRLCLPHDAASATSSPSTWAARPATWR